MDTQIDAAMAGSEHPSSSSAAAISSETTKATIPSATATAGTRSAMTPAAAADFKRAHNELMVEAAAMAAECGVDVYVVAFFPGGSASKHTFLGAATAAAEQAKRKQADQAAAAAKAKQAAALRAFVAKDASEMTMEEAKAHHEKLTKLRAEVIRQLQEKTATNVAGDGGDDDDGHRNKIRRVEG